jgi:hypothetical protein
MRRLLVAILAAVTSLVIAAPEATPAPAAHCSVSPSTAPPGSEVTLTDVPADSQLSARQYMGGAFVSSTTFQGNTAQLRAPTARGTVTVDVHSLTPRSNSPGGATVYRTRLEASCTYVVG